MNTATMNRAGNSMTGHDAGTGRRFEPIMAPSLVDTKALENLHQSLLVALRGGSAPWFADVLRDFDQVGDLPDRGRRKMPALMRGADGYDIEDALQISYEELFRNWQGLLKFIVGGRDQD
jgi:hypothetical protein